MTHSGHNLKRTDRDLSETHLLLECGFTITYIGYEVVFSLNISNHNQITQTEVVVFVLLSKRKFVSYSIYLWKTFVSIHQNCSRSSINTTLIWYSFAVPHGSSRETFCLEIVLFPSIFHKEIVYVSFISFMAFSPRFQKVEARSVFSHTQSRLITGLSTGNLPSRKSNQLYWKVDYGVLSSVQAASKILLTTGYIGVIKTINLFIDL